MQTAFTTFDVVNDPAYWEAYANNIMVAVTLWDFSLTFGRMTAVIQQSPADPAKVSVTTFGRVYISPQQAKALLGVLQQNVEQYEKAFGPIRLDQNTQLIGTALRQ